MNKVIVLCTDGIHPMQQLVDDRVASLGEGWKIVSAITHAAPYEIPGTSTAVGDGPYALITTTIVAEKN